MLKISLIHAEDTLVFEGVHLSPGGRNRSERALTALISAMELRVSAYSRPRPQGVDDYVGRGRDVLVLPTSCGCFIRV